MVYAEIEVGGRRAVKEPAHGVRRVLSAFAHREEVVVGRRRRFEVDALHRGDLPVGEVRQQHECQARAVAVDRVGLARRRLPERAAVAVRIGDLFHAGHDRLVLRIARFALVARVVPTGPTADRDGGVVTGGGERAIQRVRATERDDHRETDRAEPAPPPFHDGARESRGRLPTLWSAIETAIGQSPRRLLARLGRDGRIVVGGRDLGPRAGARVL